MKTTAAIAMAGYALAWTACAAQPAGNMTSQFQKLGQDAGDAGGIGWFGIYHPRASDAAGADWLSVSRMRGFSGIDTPGFVRASYWLDMPDDSPVFTVGYAWRRMKLEGSAFSGRDRDRLQQVEKDSFKLDSTATRLSYNPAPNWSFQFSRGTLSGLDQLEPNEDIRRTTISATYNNAFHGGGW